MRTSLSIVLACGLLALASSHPLVAQDGGLQVGLGVGAAVPVGAFGAPPNSPGAGTGLLLSGELMYRVAPQVSLGLGFNRDRFGCAGPGCGGSDHVVVTGPWAGAQYHLTSLDGVEPWVRLGAGYHRPSYGGGNGPDLDWGFGLQLGGGLDIQVGDRFTVAPQVRWASVASPVTFGDLVTRTEDPRYVMAEMALRVDLGGRN